jgi:hypothetical protein
MSPVEHCGVITGTGTRCKRPAMESGQCLAHGGHLEPEPERPQPCRCLDPMFLLDNSEIVAEWRCLACGHGPPFLPNPDSFAVWIEANPHPSIERIAAAVRVATQIERSARRAPDRTLPGPNGADRDQRRPESASKALVEGAAGD